MSGKKLLPKIIAIVGPTAVGKTSLSVKIAKKINGEIVSADSRQVYSGLNIGTEKVTKKDMRGVPHHLLDVASPRSAFSVTRYKKLAERAIADILRRGRVPIIVGGTGFYIDAIVNNLIYPEVPPDHALRKELDAKNPQQLFQILLKMDRKRAKTIEPENKRRLIRAIEIARTLGNVPQLKSCKPNYKTLTIGLTIPDAILHKRIDERLLTTIRKGLVAETRKLRKNGLSWKRINELGLEYRTSGAYIRAELSKEKMIEKMQRELRQYTKRQMRWFKRNKYIKWFSPTQYRSIENTIINFLS